MKLINTTPFPVTIAVGTGKVTLQPSTLAVKVVTDQEKIGETSEGITIHRAVNPRIEGLPNQKEGVGYIVNAVIFENAKAVGRKDCFGLNQEVAGTLRNDKGHVIQSGGLLAI